jgi:hypothetical protein
MPRNPNYSCARPTGDCCGPMVGLSLTEAHRIAVNIAKLPSEKPGANFCRAHRWHDDLDVAQSFAAVTPRNRPQADSPES